MITSNNNSFVTLAGINKLPNPLCEKELFETLNLVKESNKEAFSKVLLHNLILVVFLAKQYKNTGVDLEDLVSIGTIGLIKAIKTFDLEKNIKFITYSARCIENEILMYLRKNKKHGNNLSFDQELNLDSEDTELRFEGILYDQTYEILSDYLKEEEKIILRNCILKLPEREKEIIMLYFGFYSDKCYAQEEIAERFKISQPQVSRIIKKVVNQLKKELEKADIKKIH